MHWNVLAALPRPKLRRPTYCARPGGGGEERSVGEADAARSREGERMVRLAWARLKAAGAGELADWLAARELEAVRHEADGWRGGGGGGGRCAAGLGRARLVARVDRAAVARQAAHEARAAIAFARRKLDRTTTTATAANPLSLLTSTSSCNDARSYRTDYPCRRPLGRCRCPPALLRPSARPHRLVPLRVRPPLPRALQPQDLVSRPSVYPYESRTARLVDSMEVGGLVAHAALLPLDQPLEEGWGHSRVGEMIMDEQESSSRLHRQEESPCPTSS